MTNPSLFSTHRAKKLSSNWRILPPPFLIKRMHIAQLTWVLLCTKTMPFFQEKAQYTDPSLLFTCDMWFRFRKTLFPGYLATTPTLTFLATIHGPDLWTLDTEKWTLWTILTATKRLTTLTNTALPNQECFSHSLLSQLQTPLASHPNYTNQHSSVTFSWVSVLGVVFAAPHSSVPCSNPFLPGKAL